MSITERNITSPEIKRPYSPDILSTLFKEMPGEKDGYTFVISTPKNPRPGLIYQNIDLALLTPSFDIEGLNLILLGLFTPEPTSIKQPRERFASPGWQLPTVTFDYEDSTGSRPSRGSVEVRLLPDVRYLYLITDFRRAGFNADHLRSFISQTHLEALKTDGGWKRDEILQALVDREQQMEKARHRTPEE